jgi:putative heme-binding domain-containing protein
VIAKTLSLLESAKSQEEQFHYVSQLRNVRRGWTLPERERFFSWWLKPRHPAAQAGELTKWFADVGRTYVDGAWVDKYLREFRADAITTLSAEERTQLRPLLEQPFARARLLPSSPRAFVREWTMSDLAPELERAVTRRNFARGQQAFVDAQCLACHRFGNDGGALGPELTGAGSKYDWRSLLESIVEPSKVINEQYRNTSVMLKDGETIVGRLVSETADEAVIEMDGTGRQSIPRAKIESMAPSNTSSMPAGLLNVLSKEEVLDLLAYLRFAGKADAPAFK